MPPKRLRDDSGKKRQKIRVTKVLPVNCKILELPVVQTGSSPLREGDSFPGRTINLSEDGLLINSDFFMDLKTKLEVQVSLDQNSKKAVKLTAIVARTQRNAVDLYGRWGMGLHIETIEPKDFNLLAHCFEPESAKS